MLFIHVLIIRSQVTHLSFYHFLTMYIDFTLFNLKIAENVAEISPN